MLLAAGEQAPTLSLSPSDQNCFDENIRTVGDIWDLQNDRNKHVALSTYYLIQE